MLRRPSTSEVLLVLLVLAPPLITQAASHYPMGVCVTNCGLSPDPCPGQTCPPISPKTCNRYLVPANDPEGDGRSRTYCFPNFNAPCTTDRLGCPRCAIMDIALNHCDAAQKCVPHYKEGYVVMRTTEDAPSVGPDISCFTTRHYMVLPTRPCTGVDSRDPKCTGREGEKYWGYSWKEALALGFGDPQTGLSSTPWYVLHKANWTA